MVMGVLAHFMKTTSGWLPMGWTTFHLRAPYLLVPNHSGQLPLDGFLVGYALATRENQPRLPRAMIERFFLPFPTWATS